ncbi:hypothetical protein FNV43_RR00879 [Rhamnella rubrinervis]|uniref:Histone deacetylase n=1 Tax=Rhamnella rubrinervis TaxID=2594499 RepID=A0A8K0MSC4_9ROSA|nr:hypothetical protein FNV43_RR00879 [Rhamnella rubrinervis]
MASSSHERRRKVSYFYEPQIAHYFYGPDHPMKPIRIQMAHHLISRYELLPHMEVYRPLSITKEDLCAFHAENYVDFLSTASLETPARVLGQFGMGTGDCPPFPGLFDFCTASAGGSIGGAVKLNNAESDIAINWAGGLHHGKRCSASGFCYVNDIVLAILELLKVYGRVLYVDVDVHHGDGVEEAFYHTDRVMTVSFHQFEERFFPGSGYINQTGVGCGKDYAINVPLAQGINDECFVDLFLSIMSKVMEVYKPEAVVLQSGADSLAGDVLGAFNLTTKGHAECLRFLRSYNIPLLLLGGGGYNIGNVARCWCYETAVALDIEPNGILPDNYFSRFLESNLLHIEPDKKLDDQNKPKDIEKIKVMIMEQLRRLRHAPSVGFHTAAQVFKFPEMGEEDMDQSKCGVRIWNGEPCPDILTDKVHYQDYCLILEDNSSKVLRRGPKNAREAVKHFGKVPGLPKPYVRDAIRT